MLTQHCATFGNRLNSSTRCCQLGCQPRLMLNVIFRIRLAGRFRRVWRWRLSKASTLGSAVGTAPCDHHSGGPKGRNLDHAFRLRRHADALPSLLRGATSARRSAAPTVSTSLGSRRSAAGRTAAIGGVCYLGRFRSRWRRGDALEGSARKALAVARALHSMAAPKAGSP